MKKSFIFILLVVFIHISSCSGNDEGSENTVYKQYMRTFVEDISAWAKTEKSGFIIIPQNGHELATTNGNEDDPLNIEYINAIDGAGQEDLFYGYNYDNVATPVIDRNYLLSFLNLYENNRVEVLVTDYCTTPDYVDDSYTQSNSRNFISIATTRDLDRIPVYRSPSDIDNALVISTLSEAANFLYLIDPSSNPNYSNATDFITDVQGTNYDLLITDLYYDENTQFNSLNITALKEKQNGGKRLVICYMSIGEAEDYRYYWDSSWDSNPPSWVREENPDWPGNYKVEYWNPDWQDIIFGNDNSYLKKIILAGFDGVYLDIIDAFEYFE